MPMPIDNSQPALVLTQSIDHQGAFPSRDGDPFDSGAVITRGFVHTYAFNFSVGYEASGNLLSIAANTALFSILGTTYGGDGRTTFGLPDLGGAAIVGAGDGLGLTPEYLGETGGSETISLLPGAMPVGFGGFGQPVSNIDPELGMTYLIRTAGALDGNSLNLVGSVAAFAGSFSPNGYMVADGRLLNIADFTDLYSIIGTTYGGDGATTFALPDLLGRRVVGAGASHHLGDEFGSEDLTLSSSNLPTSAGGSGVPVNNAAPSLALNYMIAVNGLFPDRDGGAADDEFPFLGEVMAYAGDAPPQGWVFCQGQTMFIQQNQALFALLGTTYGGDGRTTFSLPDLRGRQVDGSDANHPIGMSYGQETISLQANQIYDALPVLTDLGPTATAVEQTASVLDSNATMSDANLDGRNNYSGASLTIVRDVGASAVDQFGATGQLQFDASNVLWNGTIVGTLTNSAGQLVITFNGNATSAVADSVLQHITYTPNADEPPANVVLRVTFSDGNTGAQGENVVAPQVSVLVTVAITAVNDAPTLVATGLSPTFIEGRAPATLFSGASASTIEAGQSFTGLTLTVSGLADGNAEHLVLGRSVLDLVDGETGIDGETDLAYSVSVTGGTATITLTRAAGLTAAQLQTALNGLGYENTSQTPTEGDRVVTVTGLTDNGGTANGGHDSSVLTLTSTVHVDAVNDAPEITAVPSITVTEDVASALTGISFADADAGASSVTVTLTRTTGTLTAVSGGGVTVTTPSAGDIALQGSLADINAFIAAGNLTFTTAADRTVAETLHISISDEGHSGGAAESDSQDVTLTVTPVADPVVVNNDAFSVNDTGNQSPGNVFADNGSGADVNVDAALAVTAVNGVSGNVGTQITLASGALLTLNANGTFSYDPNGQFEYLPVGDSVTDSFTYQANGGDTATVTLTIQGVDNNDRLFGTSGVDTLNGGVGNDTIEGRGGADHMTGGIGNDLFYVGDAGDVVIEADLEGTDDWVSVHVGTNYVLGAGVAVEVLNTTSVGSTIAMNLTGNTLSQTIIGNAGVNVLADGGGAGADVLIGAQGNDTYIIRNSGTTIVERTGGGTNDRVSAAVDFALAEDDRIELMTTTSSLGTSGIDLTGNRGAQTIVGNDGRNILSDGGGAAANGDSLMGRGGNDLYIVRNEGTTVTETAGNGDFDRVATAVNFTLGAGSQVESIVTTARGGSLALELTGNGWAQQIIGNAGANRLNGGGGIDTLTGDGGADVFVFSTALGAGNVDTITDFTSGTDRIALTQAIFSAIGQASGPLQAAFFAANSDGVATDAGDRIIYDNDSGQLFYDADGTGAGAAVLFAELTGAPAITFADFDLV